MMASLASTSSDPVCILLTGATGFLGKVVLEELLRRQNEYTLGKVIVIARPKRGRDATTRFRDTVFSSPCFSKLPEGWERLVEVVEGDLSQPGCGLQPQIYERLCDEISHIIHCAASISFESPILEAITSNIDTVLNICQLAKECSKLQQLVSTSTAYVSPPTSTALYEELVPLPQSASCLVGGIRTGRITEAEALHMTRHPNTYTLTKCIAEHLLMDQQAEIPITIVRPSIISASKCFPFAGWIDSTAAFSAFVALYGAGILSVVDANPEVLIDLVPVDEVAKVLINETLFSSHKNIESRIVYAVASLNHALKIGRATALIASYFKRRPGREKCKVNYLGPRNLTFHFQDYLRHKIPMFVATIYYKLCHNTDMLKKTKKAANVIRSINRVFPNFTNHTYNFNSAVPLFERFDVENYLLTVCKGIEIHLLSKK